MDRKDTVRYQLLLFCYFFTTTVNRPSSAQISLFSAPGGLFTHRQIELREAQRRLFDVEEFCPVLTEASATSGKPPFGHIYSVVVQSSPHHTKLLTTNLSPCSMPLVVRTLHRMLTPNPARFWTSVLSSFKHETEMKPVFRTLQLTS